MKCDACKSIFTKCFRYDADICETCNWYKLYKLGFEEGVEAGNSASLEFMEKELGNIENKVNGQLYRNKDNDIVW